ncbi:GNAT family N-acetyltransferase [Anaeromicrobium sediminis]|uniref:GNAT family N-acetyltransferase n=1 Tax=Anaeromicrobium sediminis TaxID=1478221 RepID=A0A267MLG4_9FIRM|nr:GNAT family N-acetyltransferase [Anaeromicrobium sediminis]PAB60431.1 GNAT family N-acetyltransferase [Anaeromicrobium sediminis]
MSINFQTERLEIRQFNLDDAVALNKICNEPYILKWMPDWEGGMDKRIWWINWVNEQYPLATKEKARVMLAVNLKDSGQLIGMVSIGNKEEVNNEMEIAYFISREYSNKGYISEAARAMAKWAFNNLNLDYLMAIMELDNYSSQRVVEKCGFTKVETRMILNEGEIEEKPFYYYRLYPEVK